MEQSAFISIRDFHQILLRRIILPFMGMVITSKEIDHAGRFKIKMLVFKQSESTNLSGKSEFFYDFILRSKWEKKSFAINYNRDSILYWIVELLIK